MQVLKEGGVIAYPTEAVWGLGCDPSNEIAVKRILQLKQRPVSKGLILVSGQESHFSVLLEGLDQGVLKRMRASWPGHTTWLVPHHNRIPVSIHGDSDKVAIRVSAHPVVVALSLGFGGAIVSTSANPGGQKAAETEEEARGYFSQSEVTFCVGETGSQKRASRIIDALSGQVLRS